MQLLLERGGIDIIAKDDNGKSPLIYAAQNGYEAVVRLLEDCDIDAKGGFLGMRLLCGC